MTVTGINDTYIEFRRALIAQFQKMQDNPLFYVDIDRDAIWDCYINQFNHDVMQEHNCNACKSFLRQYGGLVTIEDNKVVSIWDNLEVDDEFKASVKVLGDYVHSRPITDVFMCESQNCGTEKNLDRKREVVWQHLFLKVPKACVQKVKDTPTLKGKARDDKNVFKRSLDELSLDATETVLELIGQDSLYRGKEFEPLLKAFVLLQRQYKRLPADEQDNFCWAASGEQGGALNRIRNTAIGTLLIDLSAGVELEDAVKKHETVMGASNYKRPTSLVSPKMVEKAKERLSSLGLLSALNRRYANETDIQVCNLIYKDRAQMLTDVFDELAKDTLVNPRTLSKVEEIKIEDFLANVVPTAKSIHALVENTHLNNFVSLLTASEADAAPLFKWPNPFSWSYTGNIADSIKERVKEAGGNVVGVLRCSLSWSNYDDLDIHVTEPNRNHIYYGNKRMTHPSSAMLDVDANFGTVTRTPVENIIWTDKSKMQEGIYKVEVNNYNKRETKDGGFIVQIEHEGEVFDFEYAVSPPNQKAQLVVEFAYSRTTGIKFNGETKSNVCSKEKWGVKTNRWSKVTQILYSPNHWEYGAGNLHYLWMLENCISDEQPRPFFNEFLKPELDQHRKVLELIGGKVKVEHADHQLSGVGFSQTQRAAMHVKVVGKFARILKVLF